MVEIENVTVIRTGGSGGICRACNSNGNLARGEEKRMNVKKKRPEAGGVHSVIIFLPLEPRSHVRLLGRVH